MKTRLVVCYSSKQKDTIMDDVFVNVEGVSSGQYVNALYIEPLGVLGKVNDAFTARIGDRFLIWSSNTPGSLYTAGIISNRLGIPNIKIDDLFRSQTCMEMKPLPTDLEQASHIEAVQGLRCNKALRKVMAYCHLASNIIVVTDATFARHLVSMARPGNEYSIIQEIESSGGVLVFEADIIFDIDLDKSGVKLFHDAY